MNWIRMTNDWIAQMVQHDTFTTSVSSKTRWNTCAYTSYHPKYDMYTVHDIVGVVCYIICSFPPLIPKHIINTHATHKNRSENRSESSLTVQHSEQHSKRAKYIRFSAMIMRWRSGKFSSAEIVVKCWSWSCWCTADVVRPYSVRVLYRASINSNISTT